MFDVLNASNVAPNEALLFISFSLFTHVSYSVLSAPHGKCFILQDTVDNGLRPVVVQQFVANRTRGRNAKGADVTLPLLRCWSQILLFSQTFTDGHQHQQQQPGQG
jgi:hypothetical protein